MTGSKRVLLIGPAPENVGGISMHLRRLVSTMSGRCEFDFVDESRTRRQGYFNLRSLNLFTYFRKVARADVVHINSGASLLRLFNVAMCRLIMRKHTVVTVHRDPARDSMQGFTKWLLSKCNTVIGVSEDARNQLRHDGKCEYLHLPAFIPPVLSEEPPLDSSLSQWIERVRKHKDSVLMVSNASSLVFNNGQDLYGLDICCEAMQLLNSSRKRFYLVFVVVNCEEPHVLDAYRRAINEHGLDGNVLLLDKPCSFVRLMSVSDIVLRTTNTDGDSITVREALSLGVPVIASDCVQRPDGTILFETRNPYNLVDVIKETVKTGAHRKVVDDTDYAQVYSKIYKL